jgi:DNA polymerase-1
VFVTPWLALSAKDGRLHTEWHQIRGTEKNGTRTGRIASANPNLANVPNPNETPPPFGLMPLPSMRQALLPEEGCLWISADYSQQELRITAHYENGLMKDAYNKDAALDLHAFAQELIKTRVGKVVSRKHVKNVAFASIYGAGIPKLARMMGVTDYEAEEIRTAYFDALPGLKKLIRAVIQRTREQGYVPSLGGRRLSVEPPAVDRKNGRLREFDYKQANKLIQGSAADMTKEAIALYCESGGSNYFLSQVYDEINISVPYAHVEEQAAVLRACMVNAMPLSVPILVDIEVGPNWHDLLPFVEA